MPRTAPYIPAKDSLFANWAANFSTLITASPGTYGLTSGDATAIAAAETTWAVDYTAAVNPSTRTPTSVSAKNSAKVNALAIMRPYAQTVSLNAGVSTGNKIALGVNPRTSTPQPITTPTTNPVLVIAQAMSLQHVIRYRDVLASPSVKAKPYGVTACQIYGMVSLTAITDVTLLAYIQNATKSPAVVAWDSSDVGKQAYYAARWVTQKGLLGPWSPIISFTVAA